MNLRSSLILLLAAFFFNLNAQTTIRDAREMNPDGTLMLDGTDITVTGIAIGPNFRPGGLTFTLFDIADTIGITIFLSSDDLGYTVMDGDELEVSGKLTQFNGLAEIVPTAITIMSQGNAIPAPSNVTELSEDTESKLVTFRDAMLVDEMEWDNSGSFNVLVYSGTDTIQLRIDSDTDISGMAAPQGTFDVTGIGGQFDSNSPFFEGYQLFPRSASDISPYNTGEIEYTILTMREARETDGEGSLIRDGDRVALTGIVHGINLRPSGLQFHLIDNANTGITVFSSSDQFGYSFQEGDNITVNGILSEFNALAQITPEEIILNSSGNAINIPDEVDFFNEDTESAWITINAISYVDDSQWLGDGSSYNVDVVNAVGDTMRIRIDNDSPLSSAARPALPAFVTGAGSQFDSSSPFDSGYQIIPMHGDAFQTYLGVENIYQGMVNVYPNPSDNWLNIEAEDPVLSGRIFNIEGRLVMQIEGRERKINVAHIPSGIYQLQLQFEGSNWNQLLHVSH
jgi:DNA/RNA endonuclease YhcR with UshA esterase domain